MIERSIQLIDRPAQQSLATGDQAEVGKLITNALQTLNAATSIHEVRDIRDKAEAIRSYQRQQRNSLSIQNAAAELKLRAERKLGEMLQEIPKNEGTRYGSNTLLLPGEPDVTPPTYADLNIDRMEASRWQRIASVPVEIFEAHVQDTKSSAQELTSAGVLRIAAGQDRADRRARCSEPGPLQGRYRVIYADPPWEYSGWMGHNRAGVEAHYEPMPLSDICALGEQVRAISEDNAVLLLWVPSPHLMDAGEVIRAWGFEYRTGMVWDKILHCFGHYVSARHEHLLIATRGSCLPDVPTLEDSVLSIERSEHSAKPEEFRERIDRLWPLGARIELFARNQPPPLWKAWGDQLTYPLAA